MNTSNGNREGRLGEGLKVKGTLRFDGVVQIDGEFSGKIESSAKLILGPKARVDAEVHVGELSVHGTLRGQITATGRVTVHSGGSVEADVRSPRFAIEKGAFFQGHCDMPSSAPEPAPKEAPKEAPKPAPAKLPGTPGVVGETIANRT